MTVAALLAEYREAVEEVGSEVKSIRPGERVGGAQPPPPRVPLADVALVALPGMEWKSSELAAW